MAQNTTFRIYSGIREGYWYITFVDEKGIERHLPLSKKLFGKWKPESCLRAQPGGHRPDVFRVNADDYPDASQVMSRFKQNYRSVEQYLRGVNNQPEQVKAKCGV
jgi:hypothetical protein